MLGFAVSTVSGDGGEEPPGADQRDAGFGGEA